MRLWGRNQRSCRLIDYLDLLGERGRAVLNAVPVKQNLSEEAYEELKANIKDSKKVNEILRREAGLPQEIVASEEATVQIKTVAELNIKDINIKDVNIKSYDQLIE